MFGLYHWIALGLFGAFVAVDRHASSLAARRARFVAAGIGAARLS